MKILIVIMLTAVLQVSATQTLAQKITLNEKNASLSYVIKKMRTQSGYGFVYNEELINSIKGMNISLQNVTVEEAMAKVFQNLPLDFTIENKVVSIKAKHVQKSTANIGQRETAVQQFVSGLVGVIGTNDPLANVSVIVKGTNISSQTGKDGRFRILIPEGSSVLEFRYIGFKTKELIIKTGNEYTVYLEEDLQSLEETVVTGIFQRAEKHFTGASRTMTGAELKQISANDIFTGLAALDPSFRLVPNNAAGSNINQLPDIQLRGQNSFPNLSGELSNNPTQPLFILDRFEVQLQRIADLDINMIQTITFLKDASATAIYGSRGANGVMVVTTITPKPGRIQATFTNDFRITTPNLSVYNLLNAREKLEFEQRVGIYTSLGQTAQLELDKLYNERYKAVLKGVNTNWLEVPVRNGYSNRSSVYLQGGDETIRYGLQFMADLQKGVMKGQDRNNYSGQFDLQYLMNSFQFKNSLRIYNNQSNESPYGSFSQYVRLNPYFTPYDEEGNVKQLLEPFTAANNPLGTGRENPVYNATLHSVNQTKYFGFSNNFSLRWNALRSLYFETNLSLNKQNSGLDQFFSAQDTRFQNVADLNRRGSYTARNENLWNYENLTTANLNLTTGKSLIFSTLGMNFSSSTTEFYQLVAEGFPYDRLDNLLFAAQYQANSRPSGDETTIRRFGLVYNGSYVYNDRYMADISVRRDGSSQFGSNNRFGTFWSTGLGWNIHNEAFLKKSKVIDRLRLRGSYGITGSLNIPGYLSLARYEVTTNTNYYGQPGATLINLANPALTWQKVHKLNLGLEASLLKDRVNLRVDAYQEKTADAVSTITLAPSTGFTEFSENLGKLQNTGLEFLARYQIINDPNKGVLWSVNINGFTNKNILKELSDKLRSVNQKLDTSQTVPPRVLFQEGESMNTIYAVQSLGIDPATGSEVYLSRDGKITYDWNAADKVPVGINQPKWNGNFGTNLSLKGFEVNLVFNYQFGGQIYNQTLIDRVESVRALDNVDRRAFDLGWSGPGDESQFRRILPNPTTTRLTSRFVQDENNLRLTSASVGYNFFRSKFITRLGMRSLQVTAITNELFQLSSVQLERGTDNPFARTYSLTLRAGF